MLRTKSTDARYNESCELAVSMDTLTPDIRHICRNCSSDMQTIIQCIIKESANLLKQIKMLLRK